MVKPSCAAPPPASGPAPTRSSRAGPLRVLLRSLVLWLCSSLPASAAVILQYHHVSEATPPSTSVTPAQFASHLARLEDEGFRVLPLDELLAKVRAGVDPRERLVAITFDDGAADVFDNALPLLEARGWSATVFVTTGLVGAKGVMDARTLRELHARGHLVLNHSVSHAHLVRRLPGESESGFLARLREQVTGAQAQLADWLGETPRRYFAWPYGEHDPAGRALLEQLGFMGFSQTSGALYAGMDWQAIPRIPVNRDYADWTSLRDKVLALPLPVARVSPASGVTTAARPRLELVLAGDWRDRGLRCFAGGTAMEPELDLERVETRVRLQAEVPVGRSRFTCTAPAGEGRYHWYSWLWMRRDGDSWYPEP